MNSLYYQAYANKKTLWFVMGVMRGQAHWVFARTFDKKSNLLEFFVSPDFANQFEDLLSFLCKNNYLYDVSKQPNRLAEEQVVKTI